VTFERQGTRGGESLSVRASSVSRPASGAIIFEWKAWVVGTRRQATPSAASRSASAASGSAGPETTVSCGPLVAARLKPPVNRGRTSASGSDNASISPAGSSSIQRARSATSVRASSREKTPARQAAVYSPRL
jgi:hypothetical protein